MRRDADQIIDPTENVKALMAASLEALAKERLADQKFSEAKDAHLKEIANLRAEHAKELRQVDMTNAAAAAVQIDTAIKALAKNTEDTRKTLAEAMQNRDAIVDGRLGALERTASLGEGKQRIADPMLSQLVDEVRKLSAAGVTGQGASKGMRDMWGWVLAVIMTGLTLASVLWRH